MRILGRWAPRRTDRHCRGLTHADKAKAKALELAVEVEVCATSVRWDVQRRDCGRTEHERGDSEDPCESDPLEVGCARPDTACRHSISERNRVGLIPASELQTARTVSSGEV